MVERQEDKTFVRNFSMSEAGMVSRRIRHKKSKSRFISLYVLRVVGWYNSFLSILNRLIYKQKRRP